MRTKLTTVSLAVAALLGAAATANADTIHVTTYNVHADLAVHYHHDARPPDGSAEINSGYSMQIDLPNLKFRDGIVQDSATGTVKLSNVEMLGHFVGYQASGDCIGDKAYASQEPPRIFGGVNGDQSGQLIVRPFGLISWKWTCTGTELPSGLALLNQPDPATGAGPFDAVFDMPHEAAMSGKVIQLVSRDVAGDKCPLFSAQYTIAC